MSGTYTLPEVAEKTDLSLRSIEHGCREGRIEHLSKGDGTIRVHRRMTQMQIDKLLAERTKPAVNPMPELADELKAARRQMRTASVSPRVHRPTSPTAGTTWMVLPSYSSRAGSQCRSGLFSLPAGRQPTYTRRPRRDPTAARSS
ncbi:hypothetical protein AB0M79_27595 [Polymorphospora sp. NPDC051019]|uniref:hypothetical protein n=1 Tax=Polymorphospora sp. NPDC051019 TaxID=3155725 RepID=UPI0034354B15